jgi:TolB-like protein/Tfp pilus assembly protein PilF
MVGLLGVTGFALMFASGRWASNAGQMRIAVLPVVDLDGDTAQAYVADGLTEQLITELAQLPGLEVMNGRTMLKYRGSRANPHDILKQLNARAALAASIQRLGDTVRMNAQLVYAGDERVVWARTYEGTRAELLRLQQRVALSTARSLGVAITEQDARSAPAIDPAALDFYVRGRYWWNVRGRSGLLQSIDLFKRALDVDPTFALAYSGIGDAYVQLGYAGLLRPEDGFLKARAAAQRALELDSTLVEPHATLAFVAMYYDWDWETAEREFRLALERNPNYATAHEWYGLFLAAMGRFDEALAQERLAQRLDPLSVPIAGTAGWVLHYAGRQDEAERELRVALRQDPAFPLGHLYLGRVHQSRGQFDSALVHFEATGPLRGWVPTVAGVGYVYAVQGRRPEARAVLAQMDSLARNEYVTAYAYALVHTALGQRDSAFAWLERAIEERTHWLVWLNRDTRWIPLRNDPRFSDLGRRIGLAP